MFFHIFHLYIDNKLKINLSSIPQDRYKVIYASFQIIIILNTLLLEYVKKKSTYYSSKYL